MRIPAKSLAVVALAIGLAACGGAKDEASSEAPASPTSEAAAAAPAAAAPAPAATTAAADGKPAAFAQCAACHSTEKGKMGVGPSLAGVYGTKSGEIAGYAFSEPMKKADLTWDDATLDKYLTAPMKMVPGTKMTFAGLADPAARKAVIEYLKTLK